jgi:hypothetical protein
MSESVQLKSDALSLDYSNGLMAAKNKLSNAKEIK